MDLILGATRGTVIEKVKKKGAVEDLGSKHQCRAACDNEAYRAASGQGSEADIEPVGQRGPKGDQAEQQHKCPEREAARAALPVAVSRTAGRAEAARVEARSPWQRPKTASIRSR